MRTWAHSSAKPVLIQLVFAFYATATAKNLNTTQRSSGSTHKRNVKQTATEQSYNELDHLNAFI